MTSSTSELTETQIECLLEIDRSEHDASEYKFEMVKGIGVWEASPVYNHQMIILDIQVSLLANRKPNGCECNPVSDATIIFPDGSVKRPDIAIYCHKPNNSNKALRELPRAIIEIMSHGYEKKDTAISIPFYLLHGIENVVLLNPRTNKVLHYHSGIIEDLISPVNLTFACGCSATI